MDRPVEFIRQLGKGTPNDLCNLCRKIHNSRDQEELLQLYRHLDILRRGYRLSHNEEEMIMKVAQEEI